MQYYHPGGAHFVGDCMPFSHAGRFHLYYLLDENHHQGLGGLGGHQWAHASTLDLIHWDHHPLALAIDAEWEASICTGSVFFNDGIYHAFYATRKPDWTQHLGHATSTDGIHFVKGDPNPFASAPSGYSPVDLRDPFVFRDDTGRFQMLVTSKIADFPLHNRGGCLLRYSSSDLNEWRVESPFLVPGSESGYSCIPECPDYFFWNGWYYLLFGQGLKSCYRMSRQPWGPWHRPAIDTLGNPMLAVMRTAAYGPNRRIGVAWIGTRKGNSDTGNVQWGGHTVFRELVQLPDGTLGMCPVPEMVPATGAALSPSFTALTPGATRANGQVHLDAGQCQEVAALRGLPHSYRFHCRIRPTPGAWCITIGLRGSGNYEAMHALSIYPHRRIVQLAQEQIQCPEVSAGDFDIDAILYDDIIDVRIGEHRCLINRLPERRGDSLFLAAEDGSVSFADVTAEEIKW